MQKLALSLLIVLSAIPAIELTARPAEAAIMMGGPLARIRARMQARRAARQARVQAIVARVQAARAANAANANAAGN